MKHLNVIFLGPPGSGKGTQAQKLSSQGFIHISTGDLLRREATAASHKGQAILQIMRQGGLVPDHLIFELIDDVMIRHCGAPLVFDGFPRTLNQAAWLSSFRVDVACIFKISDAEALGRLGRRVMGLDGAIYDTERLPPPPGVQYLRRADDAYAIHIERLQQYREREAELCSFYARKGLLRTVDASQSCDRVAKQIETLLKLAGSLAEKKSARLAESP